jgi:site-specific recombinase XerD
MSDNNHGSQPPAPLTDPTALVPSLDQLNAEERHYLGKARAANTLRGYKSDWKEWCNWCAQSDIEPLPADPAQISRYLAFLASHGAKVGTMRRRLSALRFAHRLHQHADPTDHPRVIAVWDGIQRDHKDTPDQAAPLMPPELIDVIEACATTRSWKSDRSDEPDLAGHRDRALLAVGFFAALRRSEIAGIRLKDLEERSRGWVLHIPRSKTNQTGDNDELEALPHLNDIRLDPIRHLTVWLHQAGIRDTEDLVFRSVSRHNQLGNSLTGTAINAIVKRAIQRTGLDPAPYSAHSLRAGFATYAHLRGASDRAIAHQTRHGSLASVGTYVRVEETFEDNAVTQLGL